MTFFPPVGPQGEPTGPRGPYRPPPEDPEAWHEAESGIRRGRRPEISTTQILIGLALVFILLAAGARYIYTSAEPGLEAAILSPDSGARLAPGPVVVRIRTEGQPAWELALTRTDGPEAWQVVAGRPLGTTVQHNVPGSGLHSIDVTEPGRYRLRLVATDGNGKQAEDTVDFTVGQ